MSTERDPVFVFEQFLRERFRGWYVPDAVVHRGHITFIERAGDIPQHRVCVMRAEQEAWLRAGHDPGDEDRS